MACRVVGLFQDTLSDTLALGSFVCTGVERRVDLRSPVGVYEEEADLVDHDERSCTDATVVHKILVPRET
jgi:hypothetical protein